MNKTFNVYCDESCHLEHDGMTAMVLGAVWVEADSRRAISERIRALKQSHGLARDFEVKWTKVSPSRLEFYLALVDLFFDEPRICFRGVVIPDKSSLNHERHRQDHDTWYYKMWFVLLKQIFDPQDAYRIYLDIKDTRSQEKVKKLHDILCNNFYDFDRRIIERVQQVRSHEVEPLQLADLLLGALGYLHRQLSASSAKTAVIEKIRQRSCLSLKHTTLPREGKFNLLIWHPRET